MYTQCESRTSGFASEKGTETERERERERERESIISPASQTGIL